MTCPICQKNSSKNFLAPNKHGNHILSKKLYKYQICTNCQLVTLVSKQPKKLYEKKYYQENSNILEKILFLISSHQKNRLIKKYIHSKTIDILDIGCGDLNFLKSLPRKLYNKFGIDPNSQTSTKNINLIKKDYLKYKFKKHFDLITSWHSLEHFSNTNQLLAKIKKDLKPKGLFIFTTPNTNCLGFKYGQQNWFHLDSPRHIHLFNSSNITLLLKKNSFVIKKIYYPFYEFPLDLFWSLKHNPVKYLTDPLYPLFKIISHETMLVICQKKI